MMQAPSIAVSTGELDDDFSPASWPKPPWRSTGKRQCSRARPGSAPDDIGKLDLAMFPAGREIGSGDPRNARLESAEDVHARGARTKRRGGLVRAHRETRLRAG